MSPVSFKIPITVNVVTKTQEESLVVCDVCGGLNAMGRVAVKVDCTACNQTGYANYHTRTPIDAYYVPRARQRWNIERGGYEFTGDSSIKIDATYASLIDRASHLEFNGKSWNFEVLRDPGLALGQERLVLTLSRKV